MPRRTRLIAPGTLHRVIVRGINKRRIVNDGHPGKIDEIIAIECKNEKASIEEIKAAGRRRQANRARALIALVLVKTHGLPSAEGDRQRGVTTSAVSITISRADQ